MPVTVISAASVRRTGSGSHYVTNQTNSNNTGGRRHGPCRAEQLKPRLDLLSVGCLIAIDCEGVILSAETGVGKKGCGRFPVVTEDGAVVYDTFAYYPSNVPVKLPPQRLDLGVRYADIKPINGAQPIAQVLRVAEEIFARAGVIIGHSVENEMHMLRDVDWSRHEHKLRDIQALPEYRAESGGQDVALAKLAKKFLQLDGLQAKGHSSVEDARAIMRLYLLRRNAIEQTQGPHPAYSMTTSMRTTEIGDLDSSDTLSTDSMSGTDTSTSSVSESSRTTVSSHDQLSVSLDRSYTVTSSRNIKTTATPHHTAERQLAHACRVALPNLPHLAALATARGKVWDSKRKLCFIRLRSWRHQVGFGFREVGYHARRNTRADLMIYCMKGIPKLHCVGENTESLYMAGPAGGRPACVVQYGAQVAFGTALLERIQCKIYMFR